MFKKIFLSLTTITFLFGGSGLSHADTGNSVFHYDLNNDQTVDYTIALKGWVEGIRPTITTSVYTYATYTEYVFVKGSNRFRLMTVRLDNGDLMYFVRNYPSKTPNTVIAEIIAHDPAAKRVTSVIRGNNNQWSGTKLSNASAATLYVDGDLLHYRIGRQHVLKPLGYTVFQELYNKEKKVGITKRNDTIIYQIPVDSHKDALTDSWGILSTKPLVNWENATATREALALEFDGVKRLGVDGAYYETPSSYTPSGKDTFYRNPSNWDGMKATTFLPSPGLGTIFNDIATHIAYSAVRTQNASGFWETYPRSEWLYGDYGIGYQYMDNRRNADNVTFLMRYIKQKPDVHIIKTLKKYDAWLIHYINTTAVATGKRGILIPDYVGKNKGAQLPHTSLNHHAANMNYLLEAYLYDKDPVKLKTADRLLAGIEETKKLWVKPDHNLYYSLSRSLKPNVKLNDYFQLTRDDLLISQHLLKQVKGSPNPSIQYLIDEKNKWIEQQLKNRK